MNEVAQNADRQGRAEIQISRAIGEMCKVKIPSPADPFAFAGRFSIVSPRRGTLLLIHCQRRTIARHGPKAVRYNDTIDGPVIR